MYYIIVWLDTTLIVVSYLLSLWVASLILAGIGKFALRVRWQVAFAFQAKWFCAPIMLMDFEDFDYDKTGKFIKSNIGNKFAAHFIVAYLVWGTIGTYVLLSILPKIPTIVAIVLVMVVKYVAYSYQWFVHHDD